MSKKTVIIIPYRDRQKHLDYFLEKSFPKLKNIIPNLEIIVVEQTQGKKFNRGATINIGYNYYNNQDYDYITQDVDTNPIEISLPYYSHEVKNNDFLSIYSFPRSVGGITKFKGSDFVKINGFPNDYWGWGHEDKDFMNRIEFYGYNITRIFGVTNTLIKNQYFDVFLDDHIREDCNKHDETYNDWNLKNKNDKENYILNNGLTTLKYNLIKEEQIMENVKKITVEIY
jgi:hypothetical protein